MPQPEEPRHSRDVPATLRAFYPRGRVRGNAPLRLLDHTTRASWLSPARGIGPIKLLFCVEVPFFLFLLLGPIRSESWEPYGEVLPLVLYLIAILTPVFLLAHWTINAYYQGFSSLFTYRVNGWSRWATNRGARLADRSSGEQSWHLFAGDRWLQVGIRAMGHTHPGMPDAALCEASCRVPLEVAERFPRAQWVRPGGSLDGLMRGLGEHVLTFENERLARQGTFWVQGGDDLDWYRLVDPILLDLLDASADVGWLLVNDILRVSVRAPIGAIGMPDVVRLDTLCVIIAAIERRLAEITGEGRALPPALLYESVDGAAAGASGAGGALAAARQRDLALPIEQQLDELGRYTTQDEVARVRAGLEFGQFRADWLDDLLHHRRAELWGENEAGESGSRAS